ncbi:MAG: restriction endonuclease subunit S [Pseudomonadota bacterium]
MDGKFQGWQLMSREAGKFAAPRLRFPEFSNAGNWQEKNFQDLFEIGSGKDYKHLNVGDIPVYGSGGYMLSVDYYLHEGESACIGRKGTIDNPIFLTGKFWTVDTLFYTHSFKGCLPKYIFYIFQRIEWRKHNEAGGIPSLSKEIINKIKTFVPPKIEEQKKITDCLCSIDELITAQNDKVAALKAHKRGILQQLFPQEGEAIPRLRFPEFAKDGDWSLYTLGEISSYENGKAHEQDITDDGKYIVANSKFISTDGEVRKFTNTPFLVANQNDILMVLSDVPNGRAIARCYYVERNDYITINQRICRIIAEEVESYFLFYVLNRNPYFLKYDDGVKQTNLSKGDVLNCPVFVPASKDEQRKIVGTLSSIDSLILAETEKAASLVAHKRGLLQQLFPVLQREFQGGD